MALAHYVRARLHLLVGENKEALARLEGDARSRESRKRTCWPCWPGCKLKAEDYPAAAELYELGAKHDPDERASGSKSLAAVYLKSGDDREAGRRAGPSWPRRIPTNCRCARSWPSWRMAARRCGRRRALGARGAANRRAWTPSCTSWRAEALVGQSASMRPAAEEYAVAVELDPDELKLRLALAETARQRPHEPARGQNGSRRIARNATPNTAAARRSNCWRVSR